MRHVTYELHKRCIEIAKSIREADPDLAKRAMQFRFDPLTEPDEIEVNRKLTALNAVAGAFATGDKPHKSYLELVEKLIAEHASLPKKIQPPVRRSLSKRRKKK